MEDDQNGQSDMDKYENQASEWLAQSAEYIRKHYCKQADAAMREYVRNRPDHSLLIAGLAGLIAGAILRRR